MKRVLLAAAAMLATPCAAQTDTGSTSMIVALPIGANGEDQARLGALKARLGVLASSPIKSMNAERWIVPTDRVGAVWAATGPGRPAAAADYSGSDYRSLFVPVGEMDLTPAQEAARKSVENDPKLQDVQLVRLRAAEVANRMLDNGLGTAESLPANKSLLINLRPGLNALVQRSMAPSDGMARNWTGTAKRLAADGTIAVGSGVPVGDATLVVKDKAILGSVEVDGERFSIIPLGGGLHAIAKVDQSSFPPEHPPGASTAPVPATPGAPAATNQNAGDSPVAPGPLRVGVAFTPQALSALGGRDPEQFAQLAIEKTNAGFFNSNIAGRVALAGTTRLTGREPTNFDDIVPAVVQPGDGRFDTIHAWRRSTKANVVLVVIASDAWCGMASGIHVPAPQTYAVVNVGCAVDNLSFPHEMAHLLGARHDPDTDPNPLPFAYGHGYRQNLFRTVMAYSGGACAGCPRINYWAGPNIFYNAMPTGNSTISHDARLIDEMISLYSSYYEP